MEKKKERKKIEITKEDVRDCLSSTEKFEEKHGWGDTPYEERQVYAASQKVPVEVCLECPYFKKIESKGEPCVNVHGQPGACYYCRSQAKFYDMKGSALCMDLYRLFCKLNNT
jgi:hypothetical protein